MRRLIAALVLAVVGLATVGAAATLAEPTPIWRYGAPARPAPNDGFHLPTPIWHYG